MHLQNDVHDSTETKKGLAMSVSIDVLEMRKICKAFARPAGNPLPMLGHQSVSAQG